MKYSRFIGIAACILLVGACFLPWTYYPDLGKSFTGFFSEKNQYGRPGVFFTILSALSAVLFLIPKVWSNRVNWIVSAIAVAYFVKSYMTYTACYSGICPEKKLGIFIVMFAVLMMMLMSLLPDIKLNSTVEKRET
jgi:hypothetical protein